MKQWRCLIALSCMLLSPMFAHANDAPTAQPISKILREDKSARVTLRGKDPARQPLNYAIVEPPTDGTVVLEGKIAVYTPNHNFFGVDSFQYSVDNGAASSAPATVTLVIKPVDDAPTVESHKVDIPPGVASAIALIGADAEGDQLTFKITKKPKHGTVTLVGNVATYLPSSDTFHGDDTFGFKARDAKRSSKAGTITLSIEDVAPVTTKPAVEVVPDNKLAQVADIARIDDSSLKLTTTANADLASDLHSGTTISILPGQDARYPFGLAASVMDTTKEADGTTTATLVPATLADVTQTASNQHASISLDSNSFLGVLSPTATQAASTTLVSGAGARGLTTVMSVLNGGIVFNEYPASSRSPRAITPAGSGEIAINLKIPLAEVADSNSLKPFGSGRDAYFTVSGNLSNLTLSYDYNIGLSGLESMDMRVTSNVALNVALTGGVDASLGYYSKAWDDVKEQQAKLFGFSGKFTGLDTKNKVGKYPIAGLVFSVACPSTCPVIAGQTQTPLRAASMGGVIVWIYITANGTITLDGEIGARVNPGQLQLGLTKSQDQPLKTVSTLTRSTNGTLIDAPFFDGDLSFDARLGTSVDLDVFALGVYVANTALDIVADAGFNVSATDAVSYGTEQFGDPWKWTGSACLNTRIGAGAILSARIGMGYELDIPFMQVTGQFDYAGQWPSDAEIEIPGWHGLNDKTWYTAAPKMVCFPPPSITDVSPLSGEQGQALDVTVNGTNLPATLTMEIAGQGGGCSPLIRTAAQAKFNCALSSVGTWDLAIETDSAVNGGIPISSGFSHFTVGAKLEATRTPIHTGTPTPARTPSQTSTAPASPTASSTASTPSGVAPTATPPAFAIGDRVHVVNVPNALNVHDTPAGLVTGSVPLDARGTVLAGPVTANGFVWWQIAWDNGPTGWSVQAEGATAYLAKAP